MIGLLHIGGKRKRQLHQPIDRELKYPLPSLLNKSAIRNHKFPQEPTPAFSYPFGGGDFVRRGRQTFATIVGFRASITLRFRCLASATKN